jgi:hypothetical protein
MTHRVDLPAHMQRKGQVPVYSAAGRYSENGNAKIC